MTSSKHWSRLYSSPIDCCRTNFDEPHNSLQFTPLQHLLPYQATTQNHSHSSPHRTHHPPPTLPPLHHVHHNHAPYDSSRSLEIRLPLPPHAHALSRIRPRNPTPLFQIPKPSPHHHSHHPFFHTLPPPPPLLHLPRHVGRAARKQTQHRSQKPPRLRV